MKYRLAVFVPKHNHEYLFQDLSATEESLWILMGVGESWLRRFPEDIVMIYEEEVA